MEYVHPSTWRRIVRDEATRLGWTREETRAYLRERGIDYCDPWRVPLPVIGCDECRPSLRPSPGTLFGIQ